MSSSAGKSLDSLDRISALINKLGSAHQNYVAARTAVRDYIISADEKCYVQVEQSIALAIEALQQAESTVDGDDAHETVYHLLTAVRDWIDIARLVHEAFASYQETVQNRIVVNFVTLSESGNALVRLNALLMTGVMLDLQAAHAAVTAYLGSGQDALLASAYKAMNSAKTRINQAERSDENMRTTLQSFTASLDIYIDGMRKAVAYREKAHQLFNNDLAPLGNRTQADIEEYRQHNIEKQRKA